MRVATTIGLSTTERKTLQHYATGRKTPLRLVERSRIVLLADEGATNHVIAEKLCMSENKVGRRRKRYAEGGLKAIEKDRARGINHGGKKTVAQARLRNKMIRMTTQETPDHVTHWSTRT